MTKEFLRFRTDLDRSTDFLQTWNLVRAPLLVAANPISSWPPLTMPSTTRSYRIAYYRVRTCWQLLFHFPNYHLVFVLLQAEQSRPSPAKVQSLTHMLANWRALHSADPHEDDNYARRSKLSRIWKQKSKNSPIAFQGNCHRQAATLVPKPIVSPASVNAIVRKMSSAIVCRPRRCRFVFFVNQLTSRRAGSLRGGQGHEGNFFDHSILLTSFGWMTASQPASGVIVVHWLCGVTSIFLRARFVRSCVSVFRCFSSHI